MMTTPIRASTATAIVIAASVAAVLGVRGSAGLGPRPAQAPSPASWQLLQNDPPGGCGLVDAGRDVTAAYWAAEGSYLHLRLCTASAPGWEPVAGGWSDARYKWWLGTPVVRYMLLVEDYPANGPSNPASDGMGEITLIDDRNGNGAFGDDWASGLPPDYLENRPGSPVWRRALSGSTGPNQHSTLGDTADVGFALGSGACGPVVDVYVRRALVGDPDEVCLSWATDAEGPALDARPGCDSGPGTACVTLATPSEHTPTGTAVTAPSATPTGTQAQVVSPTPTASPTLPPRATATATATDTATITATPTASETATATETGAAVPTATVTASGTATVPPTATLTSAPSTTPTGEPTESGSTATSTATSTLTATQTLEPATGTATVTLTPIGTPTETTATTPSDTETATASPTASETAAHPPTLTATATGGPVVATLTATLTQPANVPTGTPTAPAIATVSPTATATAPVVPTPAPTQSPDLGCLTICLRDMTSGLSLPFPDPAIVHAVLLTPWGAPAKPAISQGLDPGGCTTMPNLEPGQYRVWATVGPTWQLYPGSISPQSVWVVAQQPCSQVLFRYQLAGGMPPSPPGPPTGIPTPQIPPTTAPQPTAYPPSPDRPAIGAAVQLPILGYLGSDAVCSVWVEAQNIGDRPAKALLLVWGEPGFCPPQCAGPLKVECSGLLAPGSTWNFLGSQVPAGAKSGLVISATADSYRGDVYADALCESLFFDVVGDCEAYRRFRKAYDERGIWNGFDLAIAPSQPLAVEVLRTCPGDVRPSVNVTSSYEGLASEFLGHWDPVYGGYAYFAPSVYASAGGYTSILYIQNAGLGCTSVELWFKAQDDCLRPRICDILTLAPGETFQFDASSCMPPGWIGGAWVRSTEPLAIAVDHVGNDVLMTYTGQAAELNYVYEGKPLYTAGSAVAYAPLVYSEYQGWDTAIIVQNLSSVTAAKVKVYFLDRSGGIIATVADWVCPQGTQTFFLPVIGALPGNWVGSARVESQDWFTPGGPSVSGPNIQAVAQLVQYADIMRSEAQEAIAYNLFPEQLAFDWQLGSGSGGTTSGVGRIGIPSFLKDWQNTGVTSEIAIANLVSKPGVTDFALFIYDQNGLIDYVCESLSNGQVEYINLASWGFIQPGFKGSAIISATFWEHEVLDGSGGFVRNLVGLAAVKVERSGTVWGNPIPGDESAGSPGFPVPGPFKFSGPAAPRCPGQPGPLPPGPGAATPTATAIVSPGGTPPVPPGPPTGLPPGP